MVPKSPIPFRKLYPVSFSLELLLELCRNCSPYHLPGFRVLYRLLPSSEHSCLRMAASSRTICPLACWAHFDPHSSSPLRMSVFCCFLTLRKRVPTPPVAHWHLHKKSAIKVSTEQIPARFLVSSLCCLGFAITGQEGLRVWRKDNLGNLTQIVRWSLPVSSSRLNTVKWLSNKWLPSIRKVEIFIGFHDGRSDLCQEAVGCEHGETGNSFPNVLLPHVYFSGFAFSLFGLELPLVILLPPLKSCVVSWHDTETRTGKTLLCYF